MAFSITEFRSKFVGSGARPNLFQITLPAPSGLSISAPETLSFMAKGAQIPEVQIGLVNVPYFGYQVKVPGDRVFADWTITIINDEKFDVHDFFRQWIDQIKSPNGRDEFNSSSTSIPNYYTDAHVTQFSKEGGRLKTFFFKNMFPQSVSPIELAWDANDTVEEFTVTLAYDWNHVEAVYEK